jgi:hypothetical protein
VRVPVIEPVLLLARREVFGNGATRSDQQVNKARNTGDLGQTNLSRRREDRFCVNAVAAYLARVLKGDKRPTNELPGNHSNAADGSGALGREMEHGASTTPRGS